MLFLLYKAGIFLALHAPLKFSYRLAVIISGFYYSVSKKDREAVTSNMQALFPGYAAPRIEEMAREVFVNFAKYLVDFFRFTKIDREYIEKFITIEGIENLDDALSDGKGVVAVTAHIGNWELGGIVLAIMGYPFSAVVLNHRDKDINNFFVKQREAKGVDVISIGAALRRCFTGLENNKVLALVGDRDYYDSGIEMDFFGKPTIIPKGPAVFCARRGSPVVPVFMIRNKDDTFTFKFLKPIRYKPGKDEPGAVAELTRQITDILEDNIREHPTQWSVFRRFWERIGWKRTL